MVGLPQMRLELESLTVMRHTAASLRSVLQSSQGGVHRVILSFSRFDVISGHAEQIARPERKCFLCL
jgi:hypothetical protein